MKAMSDESKTLSSLFKATPTASVDDWIGLWLCYQENNGCSREDWRFPLNRLPDDVVSGDCAAAGS